jgi:hypothetical protein
MELVVSIYGQRRITMNESITGAVLGVVGFLGLTYLVVKVRQNQRRLHRLVGVIDSRHVNEVEYLMGLVDSGELVPYSAAVL